MACTFRRDGAGSSGTSPDSSSRCELSHARHRSGGQACGHRERSNRRTGPRRHCRDDGQACGRGSPVLLRRAAICGDGPYDTVTLPPGTHKNDWELELVAVVGRRAHRLSPVEALDAIAGYTIANDLTTRELVFRRDMPEIGTDWLRAKNAPGFLPLGPGSCRKTTRTTSPRCG